MMDKDKSKAVWGASPAGTTYGGGAAPGSKEFFEAVIKKRSAYEMPWLYEIVPFSSFDQKKVLEIGCGAGYDAYELWRNGAIYTGIDITPQNIERTIKHLSYYGYSPDVREGDAENLPFGDNTFEIVFSNGALHHTPDIEKSFNEAYRVLKPGGEFWVILYHKNSFFYWVKLFLYDHLLCFGFRKRSFRERLSLIEYTTSNERPLVNAYSRRALKNLLKQTGFSVERVWVRKFAKEDIPILIPLPYIAEFTHTIINLIPQRFLDVIGMRFGWYIIAKVKKI